MNWRVGTSGWSYNHWRRVFYPEGLPTSRWFEHYARTFDTVEINATFYRMMPDRTFEAWREKAPEGFQYAVKMWQQITHRKRLNEVASEVADFLKRAALLGDRLGPILIQLPPGFRLDVERLRRFLALLSREFDYAVEFRNQTWFTDEVYDLLREHGVGFCIFHHVTIGCPRVITAPLVYLRFHGETDRYAGKYTTDHLARWADFARECLDKGHHVVAYFNNDYKGYAVENARQLRALLEAKTGGKGRAAAGRKTAGRRKARE